MKKQLFAVAAFAMIAGAISLTSCKAEDVTPPTISITGGSSVTISLNSTWSNPAATATDDEDGDISANVSTSGTVNPNSKGTYTVTYSVSDAAGNTATQDLTVTVVNDAELLAGFYSNTNAVQNPEKDTCQTSGNFTANATVTTSNTTNGLININNFGGFGTSVNVAATLSGTSITLPNNQPVGGTSSILSASGTLVTSSPVLWNVIYSWTDGSSTEVCRAWFNQ